MQLPNVNLAWPLAGSTEGVTAGVGGMSLGSEGRGVETSSTQKHGLQSITGSAEQPVCDQVGLAHSWYPFLCALSTVTGAHPHLMAAADSTLHLYCFALS